MADSKVTIQIDANAEDAKKALRDVGASAQDAMQRGAAAADKMAKAMEKTAKSASQTSRELKSVAVGLAGSLTRLIGDNAGERSVLGVNAGYLSSAGQGVAQGAMRGGWAGAVVGGAQGLVERYVERRRRAITDEADTNALADSLDSMRRKINAAREDAREYAAVLETIGDESRTAADRESRRAEEIKRQTRVAENAEQQARDAEERIRRAAEDAHGRPMTKDEQALVASQRQMWQDAMQRRDAALGAVEQLRGLKVGGNEPQKNERFDAAVTSLEKLGIGVNAAADNIARSSLSVQEESRDYLRQIAEQRGGAFVFQ